MQLLKFILLSFLFSSCFSFIDDRIYSIDSEIEPYYLIFVEEGEKRGIKDYGNYDIMMYFSELDGVHGSSYKNLNHIIEIVIDKSLWDMKNKNNKEVLIMHELGHGMLGKKHNDDCMSIMIAGLYCKYYNYKDNREAMLNELFGAEIQ